MNIFKTNKQIKTQIVATVGPNCKDLDTINKMTESGMSIARLNFSWGSYDDHSLYIKKIREAAKNFGQKTPIIQDLSGPREKTSDGHKFEEGLDEVLTEKDLRDLDFGVGQQLEYVAMSYTGCAEDIIRLRSELKKRNYNAKIIAKIERSIAVKNLDSIIKVSDAIMIARGDLGNEFPLEQIPFVQKHITGRCKYFKKPCITATQMMLSMKESPTPTRAEVTDVAYATLLGTDATMLSDETANGKYPVEAVFWMNKILRETEKHIKDIKKYPLL